MAETGFHTNRPVPVTSYTENRDLHADRPRETAARVDPVEHTDKTATDTPQQREERAAEIERLANDALRNSRLKILQDENNGDYIYMMVDEDTGEQIRRWPPEKHGDLMEYLRTKTAGLLDAKA